MGGETQGGRVGRQRTPPSRPGGGAPGGGWGGGGWGARPPERPSPASLRSAPSPAVRERGLLSRRRSGHLWVRSAAMSAEKLRLYDELARQLAALIDGERDLVANCANMAALIYHGLPDLNWAGFYFARQKELV